VAGGDVRRVTSTAAYTTLCYSVAGATLLVVCLVGRQAVVGYPAATWLTLLGLTAGPQLLGHTLVNRVVKTLSPTLISVAILFEIVGSTLLAWLFFGETPPWSAGPAALLIGAGVVMVVRSTTE
jgi:drug/metabolite transporter (DMT)-like permease